MNQNTTRELLNYLKDNSGFVTSNELANVLNVSTKTIKRQVKRINDDANALVIKSEKGRGYFLDYNIYLYKKDSLSFMDKEPLNKIQLDILRELLLTSPKFIRLDELMDKYYLSESAIHVAIRKIESVLADYNLVIVMKHRHVQISGSEKDIRDALIYLILNANNEYDFGNLTDILESQIKDPDISFAIRQKEYAESALKSTIPYPYNVNLFMHIYILLNRTRRFVKISMDDKTVRSLDKQISEYPEIFSVSTEILNNINRYLHVNVSKNEIYYLFEYLISSRLNSIIVDKNDDTLVKTVTDLYIDIVSHDFGIKIVRGSLFTELFQHILPMINRLRHNIRLNNALIDEIKTEYGQLLQSVETASLQIEKDLNLPHISQNESGFIALYFAKYLEENNNQLSAIVVCTTGIGTSELVAAKIRKSFPNIHIENVISSFELDDVIKYGKKVDLLISTIPLRKKYKMPVVVVSSLFSLRDKNRVQEVVRNLNEPIDTSKFLEIPIETKELSKDSVINMVSQKLGLLTGLDSRRINKAIYDREEKGNTTITNGIVILHSIINDKFPNFVGISVLNTPIHTWKCLDNTPVRIVITFCLSQENVIHKSNVKDIRYLSRNLADDDFVDELSNSRNSKVAINLIKRKLEESQC